MAAGPTKRKVKSALAYPDGTLRRIAYSLQMLTLSAVRRCKILCGIDYQATWHLPTIGHQPTTVLTTFAASS
jgi:hypothetical protein